jgi:hypothetical protein
MTDSEKLTFKIQLFSVLTQTIDHAVRALILAEITKLG